MSAYFIDGRKTIKTILTENIVLEGDLSFEESLEIQGTFSGTIRSKGLLIVAKSATIKGDIYSKDLIIEGRVQGNVLVYNRLSVEADAEVVGNIVTHKIKVTNNVIIDGECSTIPAQEVETMFDKAASKEYFRENYMVKNPSLLEKIENQLDLSIHSYSSKRIDSRETAPPLSENYHRKIKAKKKR